AMIGTDAIQPPGKVMPKIKRVGIRIGKPLDFSRYEGMEGDRFVLRSITDEIMYEIMVLSGQEYVDIYAAKAKVDAQREAKEARIEAKAEAKAETKEEAKEEAKAAKIRADANLAAAQPEPLEPEAGDSPLR
ncbi:MAG: 1-acyl-sn-glycerol-3-phosphate acyltransferase, partial [Actinomycetota bacterium]|nr:1-acyl-sn-glycerol-3-phosphate acyltransferase [Actinomycetota bacterium]